MSFAAFRKKQKESGLAAFSNEQIYEELHKRETVENPFPLDVFNDRIKPFLNNLNKKYDVPRAFIGLSMLSAYSTAIGTSYTVSTNTTDNVFMPVWGCLLGISSSGKSLAINKIYRPIVAIQEEFDTDWVEKTKGLSLEQINRCQMKTVLYRDSHIPTLVKSILPDNPKGVCKMADELLEWINGMNQLSKKDGTDEQFWISSWNCASYSGIRSGKQKFVNPRPFTNVVGGTQYSLLHKLFSKDRDTTGFIFRLLFARPEIDKVAEVDPFFEMPKEYTHSHESCINTLFKTLPVYSSEDDPKRCILSRESIKLFDAWVKEHIVRINALEERDDRDIQSGILGKMKEYALRFSGLLHLADRVYNHPGEMREIDWNQTETITTETVNRALRLATYFYNSALETYRMVQTTMVAPQEVLVAALLLKRGMSITQMAGVLYGKTDNTHKTRMNRNLKRWIKEYPRVFGAMAK